VSWRDRLGLRVRGTGPATAAYGGVANSGYIGELHVGPPSLTRSTLLAKVAEIAPERLLDRDSELAMTADFCSAADTPVPYLWWRGPA